MHREAAKTPLLTIVLHMEPLSYIRKNKQLNLVKLRTNVSCVESTGMGLENKLYVLSCKIDILQHGKK